MLIPSLPLSSWAQAQGQTVSWGKSLCPCYLQLPSFIIRGVARFYVVLEIKPWAFDCQTSTLPNELHTHPLIKGCLMNLFSSILIKERTGWLLGYTEWEYRPVR